MRQTLNEAFERAEGLPVAGRGVGMVHARLRSVHYSPRAYELRRRAVRRRRDRAAPLGLRVAFTPEPPRPFHMAYQLCARLDAELVEPDVADVVVYWQDTTIRPPDAQVDPRAVNARVGDISKRHVHELHLQVFGYGLEPDPEAPFVLEKSDLNSQHDGIVLTRPSGRPGRVVERLIDTHISPTVVLEYRVAVINGRIPLSNARFRLRHDFRRPNLLSTLLSIDETFSAEEQARLLEFARVGGADYADLDVLRDRGSGRLYVVDFNPTPAGPPLNLAPVDWPIYWHTMEEAWRELLQAHARRDGAPPQG